MSDNLLRLSKIFFKCIFSVVVLTMNSNFWPANFPFARSKLLVPYFEKLKRVLYIIKFRSAMKHGTRLLFKKPYKIFLKSFKFLCKIRNNQARLSKRTCVSNEISKFHKKISNLFFKNLQKLKIKFEIFFLKFLKKLELIKQG